MKNNNSHKQAYSNDSPRMLTKLDKVNSSNMLGSVNYQSVYSFRKKNLSKFEQLIAQNKVINSNNSSKTSIKQTTPAKSPENVILPGLNKSYKKRVIKPIQNGMSADFNGSKIKDRTPFSKKLDYKSETRTNLGNIKLNPIIVSSPAKKSNKALHHVNNSKYSDDDDNKSEYNNSRIKNKKLSVCFKSEAGRNELGHTKTNQDSYIVVEKIFNIESFNIFGVFDGHGINGHIVSSAVSKFFTNYFNKEENYKLNSNIKEETIYDKLIENNYQFIKSAFRDSEINLIQNKIDINFSGTTGVIVIIIGNKILCANTGDSRAIFIKEHSSNNFLNKEISHKFEIFELSKDHKPELLPEKNRIMNKGGRVDKYLENGIRSGPYRVWVKNESYPGLAMSRSIGDLIATTVGVTSDPEFIECKNEFCKYIVIASDGVWEFLDNNKIMEIINPFYKNNDIQGAINKIIQTATEMWTKEDDIIDDITAIVAFFK